MMHFKMSHILTIAYILTPKGPNIKYLPIFEKVEFTFGNNYIIVTKKETVISDIRKYSRDFLNNTHRTR